jgi:hypothetical protein
VALDLGGVSLIGLMLFAVTGITLNHAASIPGRGLGPSNRPGRCPPPCWSGCRPSRRRPRIPPPTPSRAGLRDHFKVQIAGRPTETTAEEVYVALTEPGGDGWLTIDRATGEAARERTTRGWIAYLNDLHKGRNTGRSGTGSSTSSPSPASSSRSPVSP